tara:strand:- start:482 stop:1537 length:1056 start_codon:yes stop_codon:yes gene_type:complete
VKTNLNDVLKLAFVGCGSIAKAHLAGIEQYAPRVRVTALIDPDPKAAARFVQRTNGTYYATLDEALKRGDFDAVDIMVPHDLHEELSLLALQAGKHLLLEKPMAPTLQACDRILNCAKESGLVFAVAENAQFWPEIMEVDRLIRTGVIGEVITAKASFWVQYEPGDLKPRTPWRLDRDRTGGGITIDGGSHWLRPLRIWMGEITDVIAAVDHPLRSMQGESLVHALVKFQSGRIGSFDALNVDSVLAPAEWWRVTGTRGEIVVEGGFQSKIVRSQGQKIKIYDEYNPEGNVVMDQGNGYQASFGLEIADFASAILDGSELSASAEYSLGELRTALAMYKSVESGEWERVWD